MKQLYIISLLVFLTAGNIFSQSGWVQLVSPTSEDIYTVCFINNDTGFIGTAGGKVYRTVNGGVNWILINVVSQGSIGEIIFVNPNSGYMSCYTNGHYEIYRSSNSGLNWSLISIPYSLYPEDIYFLNVNTGYIANYTNILRTMDGGITWDTLRPELQVGGYFIQYYGIYFNNIQTGFVVGGRQFPQFETNRVIWKTINGGQNWSRVNTLAGCEYLKISFLNDDIGYAVGGCNYISKTTDGGNSWSPINLNGSGWYSNMRSVIILNVNKVFTCGRWGLYGTINGGMDWSLIQIPYVPYHQISFPDSSTGYVTGDAGRIYKTTNGGGVIGIEPSSADIPKSFSLNQNYPNPFNPVTNIRFDIPALMSGGVRSVKLIIYDLLGREITTLVNEQLKPGSYEVDWDGSGFASGVYFYSLVTPDFVETKRMVLLK